MIRNNDISNTVLMVETILKEEGNVISVIELKRKLPKNVIHKTLLQILNDLQLKGKIIIGTKGILWIHSTSISLKEAVTKGLEL